MCASSVFCRVRHMIKMLLQRLSLCSRLSVGPKTFTRSLSLGKSEFPSHTFQTQVYLFLGLIIIADCCSNVFSFVSQVPPPPFSIWIILFTGFHALLRVLYCQHQGLLFGFADVTALTLSLGFIDWGWGCWGVLGVWCASQIQQSMCLHWPVSIMFYL